MILQLSYKLYIASCIFPRKRDGVHGKAQGSYTMFAPHKCWLLHPHLLVSVEAVNGPSLCLLPQHHHSSLPLSHLFSCCFLHMSLSFCSPLDFSVCGNLPVKVPISRKWGWWSSACILLTWLWNFWWFCCM